MGGKSGGAVVLLSLRRRSSGPTLVSRLVGAAEEGRLFGASPRDARLEMRRMRLVFGWGGLGRAAASGVSGMVLALFMRLCLSELELTRRDTIDSGS